MSSSRCGDILSKKPIKANHKKHMFRFIAKIFAKLQYRFRQEVEAESNELHALLAFRTAEDRRASASQFNVEADAMAARIKEVAELEEKGYWLCENGHETQEPLESTAFAGVELDLNRYCPTCGKTVKFIKRSDMSGQEKYESDRERGDAQKMADQKRALAKEHEEAAIESDRAGKYFHDLAQKNRNVADKIRAL